MKKNLKTLRSASDELFEEPVRFLGTFKKGRKAPVSGTLSIIAFGNGLDKIFSFLKEKNFHNFLLTVVTLL